MIVFFTFGPLHWSSISPSMHQRIIVQLCTRFYQMIHIFGSIICWWCCDNCSTFWRNGPLQSRSIFCMLYARLLYQRYFSYLFKVFFSRQLPLHWLSKWQDLRKRSGRISRLLHFNQYFSVLCRWPKFGLLEQTSQELQMLSRSPSDCKSLLLNVMKVSQKCHKSLLKVSLVIVKSL